MSKWKLAQSAWQKQPRTRQRRLMVEKLEHRELLVVTPLITEFMASNSGSVVDGDGNSSDWIEIYNPTAAAINLAGWHLTDNAGNLDKWTFPALSQSVLDPGEYLVVFSSGQATETYIDAGGNLHTDFRLGAEGEYLGLVNASLTVVHDYAPLFPPQQADVSYGVYPDNLTAGEFFFASPTPGATNTLAAIGTSVQFSHASQVFVGSMQVSLSGASSGQSIAYTLDGSVPNELSPSYGGPITIANSTQLRARLIQPGFTPGPVTTASYSRLGSDVQNFASQLPILLIDNFGAGPVPGKGFNQTGEEIQQVARQASTLTLFDSDVGMSTLAGDVVLHSRLGIRERGAYSSTFPEPQYSIELWDESDADRDLNVFGMAAESDWILYAPNIGLDQTLMNNQFMFGLANAMGLWAPQVQFVEAFLNTDGGDVTMADYVGLYVWTESVKRTEGRIDFESFAPDGLSGGWLLSINRMDPLPVENPSATPQHFHTPGPDGILQTPPNSFGVGDDHPQQYNAFINFDDPNGYELLPAQRASIEGWFAEMEDVLYNHTAVPWNDPVSGYSAYIDVDNFIDYYILHNLSRNSDGLLLSMWLYNPDPNNGGKLHFGPPWDHDLGSFEGTPTTDLMHRASQLWYGRLFQDPAFVERYEQRWHMWRQMALADASINAIFDDFANQIGAVAAARDGVTNLAARINPVKTWLSARAAALDVFNGEPLVVDFSASATSGLAPLTVQFNDESTVANPVAWHWDFGDGSTSTQQDPVHTYTTNEIFSVTLTVTGSSGEYFLTRTNFIDTFVAGDINMDGMLDQMDIDQFVLNWGSNTTQYDDEGRRQKGDLNLNGIVDFADWFILRDAWSLSGGAALDLGALMAGDLTPITGDYNLDRAVDYFDYRIWSANFGRSTPTADGNGDGFIDLADFTVWRDRWEESPNTAVALVTITADDASIGVTWDKGISNTEATAALGEAFITPPAIARVTENFEKSFQAFPFALSSHNDRALAFGLAHEANIGVIGPHATVRAIRHTRRDDLLKKPHTVEFVFELADDWWYEPVAFGHSHIAQRQAGARDAPPTNGRVVGGWRDSVLSEVDQDPLTIAFGQIAEADALMTR